MLNAELKSMNSNLTYVSVLSRCVRAGWRAVAMASSVERLDLYANWKVIVFVTVTSSIHLVM